MDPDRQKFLDSLKPYVPNIKEIWHPLDIEYFTDFPAPIMENCQRMHFTNINSTIAFFSPMLYFFARAIRAERILEIGMAQGYTSFYLANAVKDNAVRFSLQNCMYYGVDIADLGIKNKLDILELPNDVRIMDSMAITPETFKGVEFDIIFQDGAHDAEHIVKECEVLYPQLMGNGYGFWVAHDVYGPGYEGVKAIINDKRYHWEYVRIPEIYGIAILRKMDGYVEKNTWVE